MQSARLQWYCPTVIVGGYMQASCGAAAIIAHLFLVATVMNSTATCPVPINIARLSITLLRTPPPMLTTAIYSKSDGVAAWQTCRHASGRGSVEDIEVPGSHIGMGWNPAVMKVVADRLGQWVRQWRPYVL